MFEPTDATANGTSPNSTNKTLSAENGTSTNAGNGSGKPSGD
jgi:hypothetical protein